MACKSYKISLWYIVWQSFLSVHLLSESFRSEKKTQNFRCPFDHSKRNVGLPVSLLGFYLNLLIMFPWTCKNAALWSILGEIRKNSMNFDPVYQPMWHMLKCRTCDFRFPSTGPCDSTYTRTQRKKPFCGDHHAFMW